MKSIKSTCKTGITVLATVSVVLAVIAGCSRKEGQDPPRQSKKITIAYSTTADAVLAQVAQMQGYYLQEGLEATPLMYPYGKIALQAVLDGKADFATVAETPFMFAVMKGEKISIIATIETSNIGNAIVARKDRGIRSPEDLRGRKIAATLGTTSDFFMDTFLTTHGISRKDVTVVDLKAEELPTALSNGDVDAVSAFNPYLIYAQKNLGDRGTTFSDKDIYTWTFNIVTTQEFIRKNPVAVKKMLRSLIRAEEFVNQNPAQAQRIVADFNRIDITIVRDKWAATSFSVALDQSLLLAMEDESRWAIKNGLTKQACVPNYLDFIYFDGLGSIKPKTVRILR